MKKYNVTFQQKVTIPVEARDIKHAEVQARKTMEPFKNDELKLMSIYIDGYVQPLELPAKPKAIEVEIDLSPSAA